MFSYIKHYSIFFNVNEHLVVSFVELAMGRSCVGDFYFFCLHKITCLSITTVTQA